MLSSYVLDSLALDFGNGEYELTGGALRALQSYSWPGNIRELRNVLERAVLVTGSRVLTEKDIRFDVHAHTEFESSRFKTLDEMEREYIQRILLQEGGRVESAAKKLGIPRSSLYHKLKQYRMSRAGLRSLA
jgi:DNA-binding NtrC family response regulator